MKQKGFVPGRAPQGPVLFQGDKFCSRFYVIGVIRLFCISLITVLSFPLDYELPKGTDTFISVTLRLGTLSGMF